MGHGLRASQEFDTARERIPLDGEWEFRYDHDDAGENERWFDPSHSLPERILVPGCPQAREFGSRRKTGRESAGFLESGFTKYPSIDVSWYRKAFSLPERMRGREIWLHIGGVLPAARVWVNGAPLGETRSSRCAVRCDITGHVVFGGRNTLAIRVFLPKGPRLDGLFDAHCYYGFTGIYRSLWVEAVDPLHFRGIHVMGRIDPPRTHACLELSGGPVEAAREGRVYADGALHRRSDGPAGGGKPRGLEVAFKLRGREGETVASGFVPVDGGDRSGRHAMVEAEMPGARLWSPEDPCLYTLDLRLLLDGEAVDSVSTRFGLREIATEGARILLNRKPVFLRGGCDDHIYMDTVAPPADREAHARHIRKMKAYGFNYTKSCIEVFTKEYLDAADEEGLLVCQEMPFGLTGEIRSEIIYRPPPEFLAYWKEELEHLIAFDRNHPSVIAYSMTSEKALTAESFASIHQVFPALAKVHNPQALVVDVTHGPGHDVYTRYGKRVTDLIVECPDDPYDLAPLIDDLEPDRAARDRRLPWILHEYSWWTSLPNPRIAPKYEGTPFLLRGVPDLLAAAAAAGVAEELPEYVGNSEKLVVALRKAGLELARRHPGVAGYHFWLIANFLSTCPEGVFDEFWDEQMGMTAGAFRCYNGDTVLLLDDGGRRCFEAGSTLRLGIDLSHFGSRGIGRPILDWRLLVDGAPLLDGRAEAGPAPCGYLGGLAWISAALPRWDIPRETRLEVELRDGTYPGEVSPLARNDWTLWVFPAPKGGDWERSIGTDLPFIRAAYPGAVDREGGPEPGVIVTDRLDADLLDRLEAGGRAVLLSEGSIRDYRFDPREDWGWSHRFSKSYRSPVWNTGTHGNSGTVVRAHPALGGFPHHGWCDLSFVYLIDGARPMLLEPYRPARIDPIIRSIGHYRTLVDKAYLFEAAVGKGGLLATSLNVRRTHATHPETRYLLESMLAYAAGPGFRPRTRVDRRRLEDAMVERAE